MRILRWRLDRSLTITKGSIELSRAYKVTDEEGYFAGDVYNAAEISSPLMGFKIPYISALPFFRPKVTDVIAVVQGEGYPLAAQFGRERAYRAPLPRWSQPPAERLQQAAAQRAGAQSTKKGSQHRMVLGMTIAMTVLVVMLGVQILLAAIPKGIDNFGDLQANIAAVEEVASGE